MTRDEASTVLDLLLTTDHTLFSETEKDAIKTAVEMLKEQEAVVRCKDCKYNDDGECIIKAGWFPVKPDWFCADGERSVNRN